MVAPAVICTAVGALLLLSVVVLLMVTRCGGFGFAAGAVRLLYGRAVAGWCQAWDVGWLSCCGAGWACLLVLLLLVVGCAYCRADDVWKLGFFGLCVPALCLNALGCCCGCGFSVVCCSAGSRGGCCFCGCGWLLSLLWLSLVLVGCFGFLLCGSLVLVCLSLLFFVCVFFRRREIRERK